VNRLVTIVPGLVSFSVNFARLRDFALSEDFSFYPDTPDPLPFHYVLEKLPSIAAPQEWECRFGYHTYARGVLCYYRPLAWTHLSLVCDEARSYFGISSKYLKIPFRIGGIYSAGEHIFARIAFDLFQAGYLLCRGCAWRDGEGEAHALVLPRMNGKTTLLAELLRRDKAIHYISEDLVILKPHDSGYTLYPTAAFKRNYGRKANAELAGALRSAARLALPLEGKRLIFAATHTLQPERPAQKEIDFALGTSLLFLQDPQVQLSLFARGGTGEVLAGIAGMGASLAALQADIRFCPLGELLMPGGKAARW